MQTRQPPKFKGPYILCAWIGHPSEMLRPFEFLETFRVQFPAPRYNMRLNWTSELWPFEFLESFRCSVSRVSIYHGLHTYTRVKSYGFLNLQRAFLLGFERLDILCAWIRHPSEMLWPFEFLESFRCSFFSVLIYHGNHTNTRVRSDGRLNLPRPFAFNFQHLDILCAWIERPNEMLWKFEFLESFHCSVSSVSICHRPHTYTRVKYYGRLNFLKSSVFNFERFDILCAWIGDPSEKLWPFEFLESFLDSFFERLKISWASHIHPSQRLWLFVLLRASMYNI